MRRRIRWGHRFRSRRRRRWKQGGLLTAVLVATISMAVFLDGRGRASDIADLVAYARDRGRSPVELVVAAARTHRIVFLGDVPGAAAPKRIAADAAEALARGPGLDAVVLAVPSDLQPVIDRYLESDPEDTAILFAHPRTLRRHRGDVRAYLEIYRRIWRLNRSVRPGRRVRIVAADLPGWPPVRRPVPRTTAARYARRDAHMDSVLAASVFRRAPRARVLIFMGNYHGLQGSGAWLRQAGAPAHELTWLATRLEERRIGRVYTILTDSPVRPRAARFLPSHAPTRALDLMRKHIAPSNTPLAVPVDEHFDVLDPPLRGLRAPGLELELRPDGRRLRDVADAYLYIGARHRIEVLH